MDYFSGFETHEIDMLGRYLGAGIALGLGGIGSAIGMGRNAGAAEKAIERQPAQQGLLLRTMLIGQAVGGSPSIFALVIGLLVLFMPAAEPELIGANLFAAWIGAGLAIGLGCYGSGQGCGAPGAAGCSGVARNPRLANLITSRMIIGQAVGQSPAIFSTVIALILMFLFQKPGSDWATVGICIGSGIAIGAAALGSGWGSAMTAGGAVEGIGRYPQTGNIVLRTMLVAQGVCETPAIFGVLVAFIMLFTGAVQAGFLGFAVAISAGISVGFGGVGPGYGCGFAGAAACESTAKYPRQDALLLRTMLVGQAVAQSTAIYALIIALVMLYVI